MIRRIISIQRRVLGAIIFTLGLIGCIIAIIAIAFTWHLHNRCNAINDRVNQRIDTKLVQIDDRFRQVSVKLEKFNQGLLTIRLSSMQPDPLIPPARYLIFAKLIDQFEPQLAEIHHAFVTIQQAIELYNDTVDLYDEIAQSKTDRMDLHQLQESVERLKKITTDSKELARLLSEWTELRQFQVQVQLRSQQIENLAKRSIEGVQTISNKVQLKRDQLQELHHDIEFGLLLIAILCTALFCWLGAGQYFLMLRGWQTMIRRGQPSHTDTVVSSNSQGSA